MGLNVIGGRPSSGGSTGGGGSTGTATLVKDVGESMLVPVPFKHNDFTDTGVEITNAQFPLLYQRLNSGAKPVVYSETGDVGSTVGEARFGSAKAATTTVESNGELLVFHGNGVITATTDGLNYVYRGQMPTLFGITPDLFWSGLTTGNVVAKNGRILAASTARGFAAVWYSDDQGATWNRVTDSTLADCLTIIAPFRQRPLCATSDYFFYFENTGQKRIIRSADGLTWEYLTVPAITGTYSACYADPSNGVFMAHVATQNLILSTRDHGETWTLNSAVATTTPTGNFVKFGNDYYFAVYVSSNQLFYKSVNGGETWAASGQATAVGGAGMSNLGVCGGKICAIGTTTFATNGKHITSTNGSTWTLVTSPSQVNGRFPVYFNNSVIFFRDHTAAGLEKPTLSYDGATVGGTAVTSDLVMPIAMNGTVAFASPTRLFAFSSQQTTQYAYTDDGFNWQSADMPISAIWQGGCYDPATGKIYVTNTTSTSYFESSDNGETWEEIQVNVSGCSAAGSIPMVCGSVIAFPHLSATSRYPLVLSVPDESGKRTQIRSGANWNVPAGTTAARLRPFRDGFFATFTTTNFVGAVQDAVKTNVVGRNTGVVTTAGIFGSNSTIVFIANAGTIAYCTQNDLVTWTTKTLPIAQTWTSVINLNDTQFLLIAAGSFKALLGDGVSWEVIDMDGIPFDDFQNAIMFKGLVYIFSADKSTKAVRNVANSKRYIPRVVSPVDGFKYVIRANA
jgi:hypothetical protein